MAHGKGTYDAVCTVVREITQAEGIVLIVLGGPRGGGFSVQAPEDITPKLPALLRKLAADIEADMRQVQ